MALDFNPLLKDGFENNPETDLSNYYTKAETEDLISRLKYLKQIDDLDVYQAQIGEIVQYTGPTNSKYTRGYIYEWTGGLSYEDITIPAGKKDISFTFPNGTVEHGYEIDTDLSKDAATWYESNFLSIQALDGGIFTNIAKWNYGCRIMIPTGEKGDKVNYRTDNGFIFGAIESIECKLNNASPLTNSDFGSYIITAANQHDAAERYIELCVAQGYEKNSIRCIFIKTVAWNVTLENGEHYKIIDGNGWGGYSSRFSNVLLAPDGKRLYVRELYPNSISTFSNIATATRFELQCSIDAGNINQLNEGNLCWQLDSHYNYPTTATITTLSEAVTIRVPKIEYDENGNPIETPEGNGWQRINVQPSVLVWTEM